MLSRLKCENIHLLASHYQSVPQSVRLFAFPSVCKNSKTARRIFVKFDVGGEGGSKMQFG
jgi:hypothetical protein